MHPVLNKCEHFLDMQVWPIEPVISPTKWLENFSNAEHEHAHCLLDAFYLFNEKMCNQLLRSGYRGLSHFFREGDRKASQRRWREFRDTALFTYPDSHPAASGRTIMRKVRHVLGIPEERLYEPHDAAWAIADGKSNYLVFVDDFVGSGLQITETWTEPYFRRNENISFPRLFSNNEKKAFYIPFISTTYGLSEIPKSCDHLTVAPAHKIDASYGAATLESRIWKPELKDTAVDFLKSASRRAGYEEDWAGFHKLGLTIAFCHGIPDATLPIFYSQKNGWKPLLERM